MSDLHTELDRLAERGVPRGPHEVLRQANDQSFVRDEPTRRGPRTIGATIVLFSMLMVAGLLARRHSQPGSSSPPSPTASQAQTVAPVGEFATASQICNLVTTADIRAIFAGQGPVNNQPVFEEHGPGCEYASDAEGSLVVVQFRSLATWDTARAGGTPVTGLGYDAVVDPYHEVLVRDPDHNAVVTVIVPTATDKAIDRALQVASRIYEANAQLQQTTATT